MLIVIVQKFISWNRKRYLIKSWQFLVHESELKESGSYITGMMVDDPILLTFPVCAIKSMRKNQINSCNHISNDI